MVVGGSEAVAVGKEEEGGEGEGRVTVAEGVGREVEAGGVVGGVAGVGAKGRWCR